MKSSPNYQPPKSYWKEVDKLDWTIRESSQSAGHRKIRYFGAAKRHALWASGEEGENTYWTNRWVLYAGVSSVVKTELIRVDPATEGVQSESGITTGMYGKEYRYIAGLIFPYRPLIIKQGHVPDITSIEVSRSSMASRSIDRTTGVAIPSPEDYETLLTELRIGSSGQNRIEIPKQ